MPTPEEWGRSLKSLLPPGAAWDLELASVLSKSLTAIGVELSRVDGRGDALIEESDPRTATETIAEWERMLGLPDNCVGSVPVILSERQAAVAGKYVARGGQDGAFYVRIAAALGFTIIVGEFYGTPLRVGFRCGDRCNSIAWVHTWRAFTYGAGALAVVFLDPPLITACNRFLTIGGSLAAATQYNYKVTALNLNGDYLGETAASFPESCVPGGITNTNQILIGWNAVAGASGYRIYTDRAGGGFKKIGQTAAGVLTFVDSGAVVPFAPVPTYPDGSAGINTAWTTPLPDRVRAFECILRRAAPGHSITIFAYSK